MPDGVDILRNAVVSHYAAAEQEARVVMKVSQNLDGLPSDRRNRPPVDQQRIHVGTHRNARRQGVFAPSGQVRGMVRKKLRGAGGDQVIDDRSGVASDDQREETSTGRLQLGQNV